MSDYDVQWLPDGLQGVKWLQAGNTPDLIISDIRMPGMRGDDFLEWIKQNELFKHIPVIMLSSEDSTSERIRLLEIGAEDYIVKPFNPMEVVARVKAQLRRNYDYHEEKVETVKAFGLELDPKAKAVTGNGASLELTGTEYKILELLMTHPGRIYTKQQIFEYVWEGDYIADDSTIMVHISNLRNKLKRDDDTVIIKTVKGLGYKFEKEA